MEEMRKNRIQILKILSVSLVICLLGLISTSELWAEWYNPDWSHRMPITINSSGNLTNYQVKIPVQYNENIKSDFGDVRFTTDDGKTEISYWMENRDYSNSSLFWVKIPSLSSGTKVYMYYGNSSAASVSNGKNTFGFYQGFDDRPTGENPPFGWSEKLSDKGDFTVKQIGRGTTSTKSAELHQTASGVPYCDAYRAYMGIGTQTDNFCWEFYARADQTNDKTYQRMTDEANEKVMVTLAFGENGQIRYYDGSWHDLTAYSSGIWYKIKIYNLDFINHQFDIDINDINEVTNAHFEQNGDRITHITFQGNPYYPGSKAYYDDIRIRQYAGPDPDINFGPPETVPTTPTMFDPGTTSTDGNYLVDWTDSTHSSGIECYELQEDTDSNFTNPTLLYPPGSESEHQYYNHAEGTFYYRVKAKGNDGSWSDWSNTEDIVVEIPAPPSPPILSDPGSTITLDSYTVDWSDVDYGPGIECYDLQEDTNPDFTTTPETHIYPTESQWSYNNKAEGHYYYRVRAKGTNGLWSDWSNVEDIILDFLSISNIQVSNITQTSATVTWQTDVASNSRVRPRGFYQIYDTPVSTDSRVQGVLYAPVEAHHGSDITAADIDKDLEDLVDNNVNAINLFNLGGSELDKPDAVYTDLEERIFGKCAELGLKFVVRLEAYQKPGFDYGTEDADWIIDTFYADTIFYARNYSNNLLYYMINMPLDDTELIKPTETQQRNYVTYFYNKLKTIDPDGPVFVNFHYGCMDELNQASVADIVDGISIAQYAVRFDAAPYGVDYDVNNNGEVDPGEGPVSTDPDYKIIDKDQFDYFLDKLYTLNDISTNGDKVYIDQSGFAELINHWSGTCADRTTKLKAMDLLTEYVEDNPQLDGWFYFKVYDKDDINEQATFGILDTKIQGDDSESVINHTVVLTDLFPGTSYEIAAKSGGAEAQGPSFETLPPDLQANDTPTITITSPAYGELVGVIPGEEVTIAWRDKDTDNDAAISFYYDTDDRGRDGTLIVDGLNEDDETDSYTWDTSGIAEGKSYYIYAKIDDGVNQAEYDYSNSKVSVYPIASASSVEGTGYEADKAFDGDPATRWSSAHGVDPQWLQMDFGGSRVINRVVLNWEAAYATAYEIQVSDDGESWTDVYSTSAGDGGIDDISFTPVTARYIRMYGTERATEYGYSLWEFEIESNTLLQGEIAGNVTLQGRTDHSEQITFELRSPGETIPINTYQITTVADGSYILNDLPIGTYDLTAKSSNTLRAKNEAIVVLEGETTFNIDFSLLGGDADNNNIVSMMDFSILRATYGTDSQEADFNGNGQVDLMDLSILRSNYGVSGEE